MQQKSTREYVVHEADKPVLGLIQRNQIPYVCLHEIPAALPLWRSLLSVLAAILPGLAPRGQKVTMINV